ncbi:MAG: branched-chain amino acid ABC transporter permease [Gammaproteobacteria bacterium]
MNARTWAGWGAAALVLALLPLLFRSGAALSVLNQIGIASVFALSYHLLFGLGGMLSFGHAVFFGLGGFTAAHALNGALGVPLPLLPLRGGGGATLFGLAIGGFSVRHGSTVFAMVSLAVVELVSASALILTGFFGGEEGIATNRTVAPVVLGLRFVSDVEVYALIAAWLWLAAFGAWLFAQTPLGLAARSVRDNAERAAFLGYNPFVVRFLVFLCASFLAGVAGSLFAVNYEIVTIENLDLAASANVLLMTYIGGAAHFLGPITGAVVFTLLQTVLSRYTELWQLYLGLVFVGVVLFLPDGIVGLLITAGRRMVGRVQP